MEQSPGYVAKGGDCHLQSQEGNLWSQIESSGLFDKFSKVTGTVEFWRCYSHHSVFIWCDPSGTIVLAVYVDDIMLTRSDIGGIENNKEYL